MISIDEDIADVLAGSGLGLVLGSSLFVGPPRAALGAVSRGPCVFVLSTGGYPPIALQDGSGQAFSISTIQITVRSAADAFQLGQQLARGVRDTLDRRPPAGYVDLRARESEPNYIGPDSNDQHRWTLNFEASQTR